MHPTAIEWADFTANPVRARSLETGAVGHYCERVSPACANCYAEAWNARTRGGLGTSLPYAPSSRGRLELFLDEAVIAGVRKRRKPARLFWCSMTDVAGDFVEPAWFDEIMRAVVATPHMTHHLLTKRPGRLRELLRPWAPLPPSLWVGVTAEDQRRADERVPALREIPAAVRFLSVEPLLEPVRLDLEGVGWVIVGGESGPGSRPCAAEWVRGVVQQCGAAGVHCFVKQLGDAATSVGERLRLGRKGKDVAAWPEELRVRGWPDRGDVARG
jgi:protein gp37